MNKLIKNAELFSSLNDKAITELAEHMHPVRLKQKEIIFKPGDSGNCLYIVEEGEVSIFMEDESAILREIARYVKGDCFGEMDMMNGSPRNAHARVVSPLCTLLQFPGKGENLDEFLKKYPKTGAWLFHSFIKVTSSRIRKANKLFSRNSPLVTELSRQVYGDKLTGLFNRKYLEENLGAALKKNDRAGLIMVKPDNYKKINDVYGHAAGDQTLIIIANSLSSILPKGSVLVRFMGNETAIFIPGSGRDETLGLAKKIKHFMNTLDITKATGGYPFSLSVSIGIAIYPDHTEDPLKLIELAHELPLIGRSRGGNLILFPEDKDVKKNER